MNLPVSATIDSQHMDQVTEIRNKTDIVSLIQTFLPLKKAGHNFKTNCPFHGEKTPSFVVSPERQIWHCFGCGKGGDVYSFLMDFERMEFPEALRILAEKAGVQLEQKGFDTTTSSKKEIIYKLNSQAQEFYHFLLTKHKAGHQALSYLTDQRHIKLQTIGTYKLGFAPQTGTALTAYLVQKKKYNSEDLLEAGLATKRGGTIVDFFQGRVIFPLHDHRGNIIGFSGRIMVQSDFTSKYINTRETLVYHKGSVFFGLDSSKEAIKKQNKACIMEGELDVIAAFQEGVTNTVAIKGTALTEDQVNLLSRFTKNIALCLDGDAAGQEAMKRSLLVLEKKGLTTTVVVIPNGKDPDEAIKTDPIAFKKAVTHDIPVYDVLLDVLTKKHTTKTAEGKKIVGDEYLSFVYHISNEIVKEHYLRLLSKTIDVSYEALLKEMDRVQKKEVIKQEVFIPKQQGTREEIMEEYLVALLVQHASPFLLLSTIRDFVKEYQWLTPSLAKIVENLDQFVANQKSFSTKDLLAHLPQELIHTFDRCYLLTLPSFQNDDYYSQEVSKIAEDLYVLGLKRQIKSISDQIRKMDESENEEIIISLQQTLTPLLAKLAQKRTVSGK